MTLILHVYYIGGIRLYAPM